MRNLRQQSFCRMKGAVSEQCRVNSERTCFLLSGVFIALVTSFLVLCRILTLGILSLLRNERAFHRWTCQKRCASVLNFILAQSDAAQHRVAIPNTPVWQQEESETEVWKKCVLRTAAGDSSSKTAQAAKQGEKIKQEGRSELGEGERTWKREGRRELVKKQ